MELADFGGALFLRHRLVFLGLFLGSQGFFWEQSGGEVVRRRVDVETGELFHFLGVGQRGVPVFGGSVVVERQSALVWEADHRRI